MQVIILWNQVSHLTSAIHHTFVPDRDGLDDYENWNGMIFFFNLSFGLYIGQILCWIKLYQKWQGFVQNGWFKRSHPPIWTVGNRFRTVACSGLSKTFGRNNSTHLFEPTGFEPIVSVVTCTGPWHELCKTIGWNDFIHFFEPITSVVIWTCTDLWHDCAKVANHWYHQLHMLHMGKFDNIMGCPSFLGSKYILLHLIL